MFFGFGGVADEEVDFGGAFVAGVVFDVFFPIEADVGEGVFDIFLHGVGFVGGDDIVVGLILLEHEPHGFDVFGGVSPVTLGIEVAEVEVFLAAEFDGGDGAGDFAGDESFAAAGGFVVEEDAVGGVHAIALAVIHGDPVGIHFGGAVGTAGPEGGGFGLGNFLDLAIHLGAGGLVETGGDAGLAQGLEDAGGADAGDIASVFGDVETHAHMALGAEVVNFIGFEVVDELHEIHAISEVAVVEKKPGAVDVGVGVDVIDAGGVEGAGAADDSMNLVAFVEKKVGEVGSVLTGDACDECFFHEVFGKILAERVNLWRGKRKRCFGYAPFAAMKFRAGGGDGKKSRTRLHPQRGEAKLHSVGELGRSFETSSGVAAGAGSGALEDRVGDFGGAEGLGVVWRRGISNPFVA